MIGPRLKRSPVVATLAVILLGLMFGPTACWSSTDEDWGSAYATASAIRTTPGPPGSFSDPAGLVLLHAPPAFLEPAPNIERWDLIVNDVPAFVKYHAATDDAPGLLLAERTHGFKSVLFEPGPVDWRTSDGRYFDARFQCVDVVISATIVWPLLAHPERIPEALESLALDLDEQCAALGASRPGS